MILKTAPAAALAVASAIALLVALPARAQDTQQPPASSAAARDALAKKEGEGDQTALLKETLTAVDKQYSLIRKGRSQFTYDLTYTYIGQERIVTDYTADGLTLFDIENTNSHTITNTLSADYGVLNNLTANVTFPVISKYTDSTKHSGLSNSLGDINVGARWQPLEARRDRPNFTVTGNVRLPSGRSPFKVIAGSGEATGSGVTAVSAGLNVNRIVDPVALFGSINMTVSAAANGLQQVNGTRVLTRVKPGTSVGFGLGFAYALSYGISTTLSFQEAISAGSKLRFEDGLEVKTSTQTSAIVNLGLGYRVSSKTTVNLSVGIGLTNDSPNLSVGLNLPLAF
ncbi:hypothetical protein [Pseudoduganella armeniaca]|uniref:Transporter n=1 Tax=Pseudoduganella armeniaca TaxID=2072590 RepID=A0A2R4C889_9BURK|nr:hypothetical protein [Pseudoduganella armeniaca]AVR95780.1 hypothetical protein C9I28_08600 [Pseudoduganella armeniaca]